MKNNITLLSPEKIKLEQSLFSSWNLTSTDIELLCNLENPIDAVKGFTSFIEGYNLWQNVEGLTFCLVPFRLIYEILKHRSIPSIDVEDISAVFTILSDNTPVMFIDPTEFTPSVFRHELVHYKQFKKGLSTRVGNKFYWKGKEKPNFFDQTRSLEEQSMLEWELEAYALMYTDEELYRDYLMFEKALCSNTDQDIIQRMKDYYRLILKPFGRKLPFEVIPEMYIE